VRQRMIFGVMFAAIMLFALPSFAQAPKKTGATITGTVLGADGKPVANAGVTCETSSGLRPRAVHTDAKGKFFLTGLKQDSYDLRAAWNGAYSDWDRNIPLRSNQTKDVTLILLNGNTVVVGKPGSQKKQ